MATKEILKKEIQVSIKTPADFDPIEFYKDRKGLWVWSGFKNRILPLAKKTDAQNKLDLEYFKLLKYATDEEIESALPKDHTFHETDVCTIIAALIENQSKGEEEGALLNDGNWNLFYTPAFVVGVSWFSGYGAWGVNAWERDGDEWGDDRRVFSPATNA